MGQIADLGREKFYQYLFVLTADPRTTYQLEDPISTFVFLIIQSLVNPEFGQLIKDAFYFFIHQEIHFLYETSEIQVGDDIQNHRSFTEDNYQEFIDILRIIFKTKETHHQYKADSKKAQAIIEKLNRGRAQVNEIKAKKGADDEVDIDSLVSSLGLYYQNIDVVWNLPYYTFFDQVSRMQYKQNYDNNIVFSAAGAKIPKDKMKYWIRKVQDSKGG